MAEKISTLVIRVDLDCRLCNKKIRKTLRKFPEIHKQTFDTKQNTVTVLGHFDPEKLSKCIRCRAGKSIKDIHIVKDPPPKPKSEPPKPDSPKPKAEPPKPDSPKPKADSPKPDPQKPVLAIPYLLPYYYPCSSGWPYYPVRPCPQRVCCRNYYDGHCGGSCACGSSRPSSCGFFFSEEEQSCRTM